MMVFGGVAGSISTIYAEAIKAIHVIPASEWRLIKHEGDEVRVAERGDILAVDFDVDVEQIRRVGHVTMREGNFILELKNPIPLTDDLERILFESRVEGVPPGTVYIRALIQDEKGERLSYEPLPMDVMGGGKPGIGWSGSRTHAFRVTEAGGAAMEVYDASGGDGNNWPDGALKFVGFEVRVYFEAGKAGRQKTGRRAGKLYLGNVEATGVKLPETSFAYVDSLLQEKGNYRIAFETRAAFQGQPVEESEMIIKFDPTDEISRRQRVAFPVGEWHNSWIRYRIEDEAGQFISSNEFRWERNIPPGDPEKSQQVDTSKAPVIGFIRINPDRNENAMTTGGVYEEGSLMDVSFRIFPKGNEKLSLHWTLTHYAFPTKLAEGQQEVNFTGKASRDVQVKLPPFGDRDAFKLLYSLRNPKGEEVDSGEYIVGVARPKIQARTSRRGVLIDRQEIKKFPYFRTTFLQPKNARMDSEEASLQNFRTMMQESKQMTNHVTYMIDLADFEILPGVFDFSLLDGVMDAAADQGFGVTVRVGHAESRNPYRWHPYTLPRNFDGSILYGHRFYGSVSLSDEEHSAAWRRAFRALHERYAQHPAFEGYYLMKPSGEWIIPDEPWAGNVADYSWAATEAFRKYLREQLNLDLKDLNARWGKNYASWDEVQIPLPNWKGGRLPDLRPEWTDFSRCKLFWNDTWSLGMAKGIRAYDSQRVIIVYVRLMEEPLDQMAGVVDYIHNGGNHFFEAEGLLETAWTKDKIGWITEPHFPHHWAWGGDAWVLDKSVYIMMAQAGAGGANLHVYYWPNPTFSLTAHYGGAYAYDRFELYRTILRELHGMKLVESPKQVAVIQDDATLLTKHRTTFRARLMDLKRWFSLLTLDSIDYEYFDVSHEADYKLLILNPLDQVMSAESMNAVQRAAERGAWVALSARTGEYEAGSPDSHFPLLKRLGIQAPLGNFDTGRAAVEATVTTDGVLGKKGQSFPFYSQSDMAREIQDTEIEFNNWPYRWLPQTDYFGIFRDNRGIGGQELARFSDGGTAVSLHTVGKGKALVFWGTPDMEPRKMQYLMGRIAKAAGVENPKEGNPIPRMVEGDRQDLKRHYALCYQEEPGTYVQKIPNLPDGEWFLDDMVTGDRFGLQQGKEVRQKGIELEYTRRSPILKVLRFIPGSEVRPAGWTEKFSATE